MAYSKNTWNTGDVITKAKMDNIENGIAANDTAITGLKTSKQNALADGTNGQVLTTDGSGNYTFKDIPKQFTQQEKIEPAAGGDEKDKINAVITALTNAGILKSA